MFSYTIARNLFLKLTQPTTQLRLSSTVLVSIVHRLTYMTMTNPGVPLHEVIQKLNQHASPSLAESWDNVGLLVEPSSPHRVRKLFLTNDLTEDVLEEAVNSSADCILSYHPPIFKGIKRITQDQWKDRLVVKCLENRIAIYSPHTAYDVVKGGVNDWLISCFDGKVSPINQNEQNSEFGTGRICLLNEPLTLDIACAKVKEHLGLSHLRVGHAKGKSEKIQTIACCAGSGSSVLSGVKAELYLTGEMSHHEVLDAVSNNVNVVLCEHSNTERGYLKTLVPVFAELFSNKLEVVVSESDKDPLLVI